MLHVQVILKRVQLSYSHPVESSATYIKSHFVESSVSVTYKSPYRQFSYNTSLLVESNSAKCQTSSQRCENEKIIDVTTKLFTLCTDPRIKSSRNWSSIFKQLTLILH